MKGSLAPISQHPRSAVQFDPVPPADPRDPPAEDPYAGLPVPGHSEPINLTPPHLLALRGTLPADTCGACGEPTALHYDTTGCQWVGCAGVPSRKALAALTARPMRDLTVWGDQHPKVSSAIRDGLRVACGPAVATFFETLGHEDRIAFSRRLAELAVVAHLQEQAQFRTDK